jgi:hypothetical protein
MDVWRIILAVSRRWYVLLPLLAVSGVAMVAAGNRFSPEYEATGSFMLAPQKVESSYSPYSDMATAIESMVIVLGGPEARSSVATQGLAPTYEVGALSRTSIMSFAVRTETPEIAVATGEAIIELARAELATRQGDAGLEPDAQVTIQVLQRPAVAQVVPEGKVRTQAVIGLLGAALAAVIAILFDDLVGLVRRMSGSRAVARTNDKSGDSADEDHPAIVPTQSDDIVPTQSDDAVLVDNDGSRHQRPSGESLVRDRESSRSRADVTADHDSHRAGSVAATQPAPPAHRPHHGEEITETRPQPGPAKHAEARPEHQVHADTGSESAHAEPTSAIFGRAFSDG